VISKKWSDDLWVQPLQPIKHFIICRVEVVSGIDCVSVARWRNAPIPDSHMR
jgi:hypothetical protein